MTPAPVADTVLLSNNVLWLRDEEPVGPGFVAVKDGVICGTGHRDDASLYIGADTFVRDLGARALAPGFVDVHAHMEVAARVHYQTVDCRAPACGTIPQVLDRLRAHLSDAVDGWLVGQANLFFDQKLAEKRLPTRQELDSVSTDVAIVLRAGGHISVLNSRALLLAGIDASYEAADHSITGLPTVVRDDDGQPTGVVKEMDNLLPMPSLPADELPAAIGRGVREQFSRFGVTTIGEISESMEGLTAMDQLHLAGDLGARIRVYLWVPGTTTLDEACTMATDSPLQASPDLIRIHGVKMFADGGFSARSAAVKQPYVDEHGFCGEVALSSKHIAEALTRTAAAGLQLAVHANGDRAQESVCDAIVAAGGIPEGAPRTRIEHAGNFLPEPEPTIRAWKAAGIVPVPQPVFLYTFGDFFPTYLGRYGEQGRFPFRDLLDQGWSLSGSSDVWIGSEQQATNPFFSIWCTLARRSFFDQVIDGDQTITLTEALRMHTIGGARVLGECELYGSLEVGKHADVIVLDRDPYSVGVDDLLDIKVDEVYLGGREVYKRSPVDAS
ncbi:amidohydrolase [Nocardioides glacieisoli]|uniref:Amidohydrolase n=1 Tax=Nocardioides glacieisoli TaxID=1168730 RepID=A0A4Q2RTD3_9ACTN|nr:amidohydrolase [Nocardioides glacieisoli]RYB92257.1 amidohydrolase [Nocardioides glacieisoli]